MNKSQTQKSSPAPKEHVVIGAGIAGLTAALSLANFGFSVLVLEKAKQLEAMGVGIQLSPNATSILARIGVLDALLPKATVISSIELVDARSTKSLLKLDAAIFARETAPFLAVGRGDLQMALLAAAQAHPNITLQLGAHLETQKDITAKCVIGADGVWSQTRQSNDGKSAQYSGYVAKRATIGHDHLLSPALCLTDTVRAFVAPHGHLVAYPIEGGSRVNLVFIGKQKTSLGKIMPLELSLAGFAEELANDLARVDDWTDWPIYTLPDAGCWRVNERTMLIGDAAHAMLPFAAQGAGMAIEDGFTIAHCLFANPSNTEAAFNAYEQMRRGRIHKIVQRSKLNAFAYHASGPIALARNLTFALKGQQLMHDLKWLYDYRVPGL